ncbi:MAG: T9SS type A sorting domain-containing protein [Flavobacteriaceae bacterium]
MIKKYFTYLFFVLTLSLSAEALAQDNKSNVAQKTELNFYPNPVSDGKIYITSTTTSNKEVEIFDVLGKSVLKATIIKELNIGSLAPGVYLIKIKDGENSVTRKLVVK